MCFNMCDECMMCEMSVCKGGRGQCRGKEKEVGGGGVLTIQLALEAHYPHLQLFPHCKSQIDYSE